MRRVSFLILLAFAFGALAIGCSQEEDNPYGGDGNNSGNSDGDGDGEVTAGELHGYVTQAMRALVRDRRQRPTLLGESDTALGRSAQERGPDLAQMVLESARSGR